MTIWRMGSKKNTFYGEQGQETHFMRNGVKRHNLWWLRSGKIFGGELGRETDLMVNWINTLMAWNCRYMLGVLGFLLSKPSAGMIPWSQCGLDRITIEQQGISAMGQVVPKHRMPWRSQSTPKKTQKYWFQLVCNRLQLLFGKANGTESNQINIHACWFPWVTILKSVCKTIATDSNIFGQTKWNKVSRTEQTFT